MTAKDAYTIAYRIYRETKGSIGAVTVRDATRKAWDSYHANFISMKDDNALGCARNWRYDYSPSYLREKVRLAYRFNTDFNVSKVASL